MEDALESALMIVYQFLAVSANFEILLIEIFDKVLMFRLLDIHLEPIRNHKMTVKIVIKRQFKKNAAQKAFELINNFRREAMGRKGYISGETWVNHYDPCRIAVVSTWQSVEDWIHWEESDQRTQNEAKLNDLLQTPAKFEIYDLGVFPT
jgi:heme-degrading monooxygenase HmoA